MRFPIFVSLIFSGLLAATGCSAPSQAAGAPASPLAGHVSDTSSWTPPGQMDLVVDDAPVAHTPSTKARSLPEPNRQEIPRGQIRAVLY